MTPKEITLASYKIDKNGLHIENFMVEREPRGQLLISAEYLVAALLLDEQLKDFPVKWSGYMLACQSLELSLKAALNLAGVDPQELRRKPLNHDLDALLDRCVAMPEFVLDQRHIQTIKEVAPSMSAFTFRYGLKEAGSVAQPAQLRLPPLIQVIAAANGAFSVAWRLFQTWPDQYTISNG